MSIYRDFGKKDGACLISTLESLTWFSSLIVIVLTSPLIADTNDREIAIVRKCNLPDCRQAALSYRNLEMVLTETCQRSLG
jgi:hypothetical protein